MLPQYGYLGIFLLLAVIIAASMLLIPWALTFVKVKPANPTPVKVSTYESGLETYGATWVRFNFRYYFFALLFVLFDIQTVFLYPWAVRIKQLEWFGLAAMLVFVAILLVGLLYAWRKKALEWT